MWSPEKLQIVKQNGVTSEEEIFFIRNYRSLEFRLDWKFHYG
jgi:hypothetical protein